MLRIVSILSVPQIWRIFSWLIFSTRALNPEDMEDFAYSSSHVLSRRDPKVCQACYFCDAHSSFFPLIRLVVLAISDQICRVGQHLCLRIHRKHVLCGTFDGLRPARTRFSHGIRKTGTPNFLGSLCSWSLESFLDANCTLYREKNGDLDIYGHIPSRQYLEH